MHVVNPWRGITDVQLDAKITEEVTLTRMTVNTEDGIRQ